MLSIRMNSEFIWSTRTNDDVRARGQTSNRFQILGSKSVRVDITFTRVDKYVHPYGHRMDDV